MGTPMRKRLGLADRTAEGRTDRGVMARSLMYPYAVGGVLALAAAAGTGADNVVRLGLTASVCWIVVAALLIGYEAMPPWTFSFLPALATVMLLWTVYADGAAAQSVAPLLAVPAAYAMFFLRKPHAIGTTLLASAGFVVAAVAGPGMPLGSGIVTAAGIAAAGALVGMQR